MNMRQQAFVDEYITNGGNATQAALSARYSEQTAKQIGARLLTNVDIQEAISARNKEIEQTRIMNLEECLSLLTSIARGELTVERVRIVDGVAERYFVKPTVTERTKAAEIRLKSLGVFVDRTENKPTPSGSEAVFRFEAALREFSSKRAARE